MKYEMKSSRVPLLQKNNIGTNTFTFDCEQKVQENQSRCYQQEPLFYRVG